jgi:hypothetical protein
MWLMLVCPIVLLCCCYPRYCIIRVWLRFAAATVPLEIAISRWRCRCAWLRPVIVIPRRLSS